MQRKSWKPFTAALLTVILALGAFAHAQAAQAAAKGAHKYELTGVVNINTAPEAKLRLLPGVGPKKAQAIIAHRTQKPFMQPTELMQVKGFTLKMFNRVKDHVATAGDTTLVRRKLPAEATR